MYPVGAANFYVVNKIDIAFSNVTNYDLQLIVPLRYMKVNRNFYFENPKFS